MDLQTGFERLLIGCGIHAKWGICWVSKCFALRPFLKSGKIINFKNFYQVAQSFVAFFTRYNNTCICNWLAAHCAYFFVFVTALKIVSQCSVTVWNRVPLSWCLHHLKFYTLATLVTNTAPISEVVTIQNQKQPISVCCLWTIAFYIMKGYYHHTCLLKSEPLISVGDAWARVNTICQLWQIQFLAHLIAVCKAVLQSLFRTLAIQNPLSVLSTLRPHKNLCFPFSLQQSFHIEVQ